MSVDEVKAAVHDIVSLFENSKTNFKVLLQATITGTDTPVMTG